MNIECSCCVVDSCTIHSMFLQSSFSQCSIHKCVIPVCTFRVSSCQKNPGRMLFTGLWSLIQPHKPVRAPWIPLVGSRSPDPNAQQNLMAQRPPELPTEQDLPEGPRRVRNGHQGSRKKANENSLASDCPKKSCFHRPLLAKRDTLKEKPNDCQRTCGISTL